MPMPSTPPAFPFNTALVFPFLPGQVINTEQMFPFPPGQENNTAFVFPGFPGKINNTAAIPPPPRFHLKSIPPYSLILRHNPSGNSRHRHVSSR